MPDAKQDAISQGQTWIDNPERAQAQLAAASFYAGAADSTAELGALKQAAPQSQRRNKAARVASVLRTDFLMS